MVRPAALRRKLAAALVFAGCVTPQDAFTSGRALDPCSGAWPVCNTVAGCALDGQNYATGALPGGAEFLVRTTGAATVAVSVFLTSVSAAGSQTTIDWWETGCSSRFEVQVPGTVFAGESQQLGAFTRQQDLSGAGDHRITFASDATGSYLIDVTVTPKD